LSNVAPQRDFIIDPHLGPQNKRHIVQVLLLETC